MGKTIRLKGYFGDGNGKPVPGDVSVSYVSHGASEMLTIAFDGRYRCDLPYRPVEALAREVRHCSDSAPTLERHTVLRGYYSGQKGSFFPGRIIAWFRRSAGMEMLTVEFEQAGQISVPFAPLDAAVGAERRERV